MPDPLSLNLAHLKASETVAISAETKRRKAAGEDVYDLSVGEPDFDTPAPIRQAAIDAIQKGFTRYPPNIGLSELRTAIADRRAAGAPVRIVDVAAGHGRYVLDAITAGDAQPDSIVLRDYSERNVEQGNALITARALGSVATFVKGDAFDRADLASLTPRPTIAIVSGLYELFPDNAMVRDSLAGLAEALLPDSLLIYTGQPWHPQLELIARGLTSHRGGAWVMRRRTQMELDQLVAAAGFRKIDQRIDAWGIFTVSLARRAR